MTITRAAMKPSAFEARQALGYKRQFPPVPVG
ncbi:hypothetical protein LPU83_pLPU83c_0124 (plasmid) [Rhizobium favelukesii]|uniref:Uncharacterized protein n=1 Tax=Rhizobium favelukesii TaxID=348824 RepID=W6S2R1_9HYPH|nr:hypothetical protein LPU83_pLPU83c_0124 [Rhizobium favelukesii]